MSATRAIYRQEVIDRAREHVAAGWSLEATRRHLAKEFDGKPPSRTTIQTWADEGYAQRRRVKIRTAERRSYVPKPRRISPELRVQKMRQLREAGARFKDIGIVSGVLWGERLDAEQVRYRLARRAGS